jgi:hypothetical protein
VLSDTHLFSGSADLTVRVWALDHLHIQHLASMSAHGKPVHALALSRDRMLLLVATAANAVTVWSVAQPAQPAALGTLDGHAAPVWALATSWDPTVLWSGARDGSARLWRLRNLPHQQLADALVQGDWARATALATAGVLVPPQRWDDSLAAGKAVSANQMLGDVLRAVKEEAEQKGDGAGGLQKLRGELEEALVEATVAIEDVKELESKLAAAQARATAAQERLMRKETRLTASTQSREEYPVLKRLMGALDTATHGLQLAESRCVLA